MVLAISFDKIVPKVLTINADVLILARKLIS